MVSKTDAGYRLGGEADANQITVQIYNKPFTSDTDGGEERWASSMGSQRRLTLGLQAEPSSKGGNWAWSGESVGENCSCKDLKSRGIVMHLRN